MNDTLLWYTTRGAGAVSLLLLSAVVTLGVLTAARFEAPGWPRFVTAALHRNLSLTALVFLALHVLTAVTDPFAHLGLTVAIVPFTSWYRPLWVGLGTIAVELVVAVAVTSLLRRRLGHAAWRAVHWLAYAAWPVALVHGVGAGTDGTSDWMVAIDVFSAGAVLTAVAGRLFAPRPDPLADARDRFRTRVQREISR
ncbi:MAG TPA: ferric reductase-like transmembrane domain-containing protein [Terriglobales bacterium]|nr:ferric reductase-like transmembrane domain-containing protein [Terriglobales bacterium]